MDEFIFQCTHHLQAIHPASDIDTTLRALPTLLSPPSTSPVLSPKSFFVAFHGTLTLAFAGWPQCVRERKARMDAALCAHGTQTLTEENAGTRWPKVTLGVLEEGVVMEERDARRLLSAVDDLNKELLSKCYAEERLDALDIVLFDKRSQESRLASYMLDWSECNMYTKDDIDPESSLFVGKVLAESEDFGTYFPHVNNTSRRRAFYNETCTPEISIVHFLKSVAVREIIAKFRIRIDYQFPNLYWWIPDGDLHASLRAVNFVNRVL